MELQQIAVRREQDESPDVSWLEDVGRHAGRGITREELIQARAEDAARLEAFNRDEWTMVGVYATAEITVAGVVQTIRTGGLWGIESDSDPDYFATVGREELDQLAAMLEELGATPEQLQEVKNTAPAPVEYV